MKHVQVFRLGEPTTVAIPNDIREIQCHVMSGRRPVSLIGDEQPFALPLAETVTCPIHCLKHAIKGSFVSSFVGDKDAQEWVSRQYGPGYEYNLEQGIWIKTQYIAMGPELFEMLDTVIRRPYEERERVRAARLQDAYKLIEKHRRIVNSFWALPWYKRAWFAITGGC